MEVEVCYVCGTTEDLTFGPDPFQEEIHGDSTPVVMCGDCYSESALDI